MTVIYKGKCGRCGMQRDGTPENVWFVMLEGVGANTSTDSARLALVRLREGGRTPPAMRTLGHKKFFVCARCANFQAWHLWFVNAPIFLVCTGIAIYSWATREPGGNIGFLVFFGGLSVLMAGWLIFNITRAAKWAALKLAEETRKKLEARENGKVVAFEEDLYHEIMAAAKAHTD